MGIFIGFVLATRRIRKENSPPNNSNVLTPKDLYKDPATKIINLTNNQFPGGSAVKELRGSRDSMLDTSYDPYNATLEKTKKSYV